MSLLPKILAVDPVIRSVKRYTLLTNHHKDIAFVWIPFHVDIPGNELGNSSAVAAAKLPCSVHPVSLLSQERSFSKNLAKPGIHSGNNLHLNYVELGKTFMRGLYDPSS